jgi:hypothetical protein
MNQDNIYNNNYNYVNKNYSIYTNLLNGIYLAQNNLMIEDTFYTKNNKVYIDNLRVYGNNTITNDNVIKNVYVYGGVGIKKDLYLNGQMNILADYDITPYGISNTYSSLKIFDIMKFYGKSYISGNLNVSDILSLSELTNKGNITFMDQYIRSDYKISKNIYGNVYIIEKNISTKNIYSNIISNNIVYLITDNIKSNIIDNYSITVKEGDIKKINTNKINITRGENIGNLNLNGCIVGNVYNILSSNITVGNISGNVLFISGGNLNTKDINSNMIISSNTFYGKQGNVYEYYGNNIIIENIIFDNYITTETITSSKITVRESAKMRKTFGKNSELIGNTIIEGGFSEINKLLIGDNTPIFNLPAFGNPINRDGGFIHIYEKEFSVPSILYKKSMPTVFGPIGFNNDLIAFSKINIRNISSSVPMKEIYFDNAQVIELLPVHMRSIAGNNLHIRSNNNNMGNTIFIGNIDNERLITNDINIDGNIIISNLNSNIVIVSNIDTKYIYPISGNVIISNIFIKNVDINTIYSNNTIANTIYVSNINITNQSNMYVNDVIINGNLNTIDLYSNNLNINGVSDIENIVIEQNVITSNIYSNNFVYNTVYISSNTNITSQINIIQNYYACIDITLNNGIIGENKYFILDDIEGYESFINTEKGTYYLDGKYNYIELIYDGDRWRSIDNISMIPNMLNVNEIKNDVNDAIINYSGNLVIGRMDDRIRIYGMSEIDIMNNVDRIVFSKSDDKYIVSNSNSISVYDYNNIKYVIPYNRNIYALAYANSISVIGNDYYNGSIDIYDSNIFIDRIITPNIELQGRSIDISIDGNIIIVGGLNNGIIYERNNKDWTYEMNIGEIRCGYYEEGNLYVGGNNILKRIEIYNNKVYDFGIVNGNINEIVKYEGNIVVCGRFNNISGVNMNNIGYWKNGWYNLNSVIQNEIYCMISKYGNIYIGNSDGIKSSIYVYNNNWNNIIDITGDIRCIDVYNGNIYIGTTSSLYRYDNNIYDLNIDGYITLIKEYKGNIYIGGNFSSYGGYRGNFGIWNDGWRKSGIISNDDINGIWGYDDKLLISGKFKNMINNIEIYVTNNIVFNSDLEYSNVSVIQYDINEKRLEEVGFNINKRMNRIIYDSMEKIYMMIGEEYDMIKKGTYNYIKSVNGNSNYINMNEGLIMGNIVYDIYSNLYIERSKYDNIRCGSYNNDIIYSVDGGNIIINNEYWNRRIQIPENGNIDNIRCDYLGKKIVIGINKKIYIYN